MDTKLDTVLGDYQRCREIQGCEGSYLGSLEAARQLTSSLPLIHGTGRSTDLIAIVRQGKLQSRLQRGLKEPKSWSALEITGKVFTALGVLYPDRLAALVFGRDRLLRCGHQASPWDSGRFWTATLNPPVSTLHSAPKSADRAARFDRYSLTASECWEHMAQHVASCFASPRSYALWWCQKADWSDPLGALQEAERAGSPLLRSIEVRFDSAIPIDRDTLCTVFLPANAGNRDYLELRARLSALNVEVIEYDGAEEQLRRSYEAWIRTQLDGHDRSGGHVGGGTTERDHREHGRSGE